MGAWGAGLYDDDEAADLRDTIALVCKVPGDGDRLFDALAQVAAPPPPGADDESAFWLVVADHFEKRGLACTRVAERALALIASGVDLERCRALDADAAFLRKRAKVLDELAARLRAPRPVKPAKKPGKPPAMVLETGEVHVFPTMKRVALHPYWLPRDPPFAPDGWGALVVLDTGRMFDWLPWVALAALDVDPGRKPTLADACAARLVPHLQT